MQKPFFRGLQLSIPLRKHIGKIKERITFKLSAKPKAHLDIFGLFHYWIDLCSWAKTTVFPGSLPQICRQILGPITSWQTDGEKMETVTDFIFLGSKITVDSDCSHEIKRCLLLGRKAMTNLHCIKKQRCHFADKGLYSQSHCFSSSHVCI